jgi:LacI family transcriptional regulator
MLAEQLGVHVSTVSRALNAKPNEQARAASQSTVLRIRALADELGYRPNPHATSLRTRRSNLVGVLVPRLSDIVLATIYEGIEEAAAEHALSTFVTNTRDDPDAQRARADMMLGRLVDGIIFGDAYIDGRFLSEFATRGVPFVLVNRRCRGHPSVTCDDYEGGRLAAGHLLSLGHTDVAVIAGEPYTSTGIDRTAGFLDRYAEAGIEVATNRVLHSRFDARGGRVAAEELLAGPHPPSAIFAVNDFAAIGALGAARDRGMRSPSDIAMVGYNDTPLAAQLPVPLTTVRSPMHEMGRLGLDMLIRLIGGERPEPVRLAPELIARASSGATG